MANDVIVSTNSTPKPRQPWAASPKDRAETALLFVGAAVASFILVAITPLKGKLAYVAVFFIAFIAIDFAFNYIKRGNAAAKDSIFRGFVTAAIVIAVMPIISILATVWIRGHKGLHWTLSLIHI